MDHPLLKKTIIKVLQDILKGKTLEPEMGLCSNVGVALGREFGHTKSMLDASLDLWISIQEKLYSAWPKYSGSESFPVPAPKDFTWDKSSTRRTTPYGAAYSVLPMYEGEYGKLRLELAQFLVNELKLEINHR